MTGFRLCDERVLTACLDTLFGWKGWYDRKPTDHKRYVGRRGIPEPRTPYSVETMNLISVIFEIPQYSEDRRFIIRPKG